jgi:ferritin
MAIINKKIIDLLNYRIEQEEQSSRIYKAMSVWLNKNGFMGASKLWDKYSEEELIHADWVYDYLLALDILPETPAQTQPKLEFKGLPNIIALSFAHEIEITNQCKELSIQCLKEYDVSTFNLAQRFVKEQVEELEKMQTWIDKLQAFGDSKEALFLLDQEMGK